MKVRTLHPSRRTLLEGGLQGAVLSSAIAVQPERALAAPPVSGASAGSSYEVTCLVRYAVTTRDDAVLTRHARALEIAAARYRGRLLGFFAPHEETETMGLALLSFPALVHYEAYSAEAPGDIAVLDGDATAALIQGLGRSFHTYVRA